VAEISEKDTYVRARALVSAVFRLPEGERDRFLEAQCAEDARLRKEVAWLLDVLRSPDNEFMETGPDLSGSFANDALHVAEPHDYTLLRQLGEGGMGVVWLAERTDGEIQQQVAIKLLNTAALSNQTIVARFLAERKLVARLNHPNIAHLVDAGALGDGRPFLAMEYIKGTRLDDYCNQHKLSIEQRIGLFIKVCLAVQYAHEQLIIHRDIKPANILVTEQGEPKLLDFGIARVIAAGDSEVTSTVANNRILTLAYASPEQIEGRTLSTATDVYSLGIVLYELLTGVHPWGDTTNPAEIVQKVARSEPERPSTARRRQLQKTDPSARAHFIERWRLRELPRDLDVIVLKALAKSPSERYSSPRAFADDLRRFLENRPVEARRAHNWYRLRKFVRRNRLALAAASAMLALIIGFAINRQIQLDRTRAEQAKTEQVRNFLLDLFAAPNLDKGEGREITAREIVDRGADKIHASLGADPATKAMLLGSISSTYQSLGLRDKAQTAVTEALELARKDPNTTPDEMVNLLLTQGTIYGHEQDVDQQERVASEALAIAESDSSVSRLLEAVAIKNVAMARGLQGKPQAEVEPLFKKAIAILEHVDNGRSELIDTRQAYGIALRNWDNAKEGLAQLKLALDGSVAEFGEDAPRTVAIRAEYGLLMERAGDAAAAETILRRAFEQQVKIYGADNPKTSYVRSYLAFALMSELKWAEAEPLLRKTLEMGKKYDKDGNSNFNNVMNDAYALRNLKRYDEAESLYREALTLVDTSFAAEQRGKMRGAVHSYLGQTLREDRKIDQAKIMLEDAIAELPTDELQRIRAGALRALAAIALEQHDLAAAEKDARAAVDLYDKDTWFRAEAVLDLTDVLIAQHRYPDAQPLLQDALARLAKEFPASDERVVRAANALAVVYEQTGQAGKAGELHEKYHSP